VSKRGKFIVLEGIDGAGTTTQAGLLHDWVRGQGIPAVTTREPSDGPIGALIRNALKGRIRLPGSAGPLPAEAIALLFAADRIDHLHAEIEPALEKGAWVISDRYLDSSVAYQGTLIDNAWVQEINRYAVTPDLTFFLKVDVDVALARISGTRVSKDLFETRDLLTRIAAGYDRLYATHPGRADILDSSLPLGEVHDKMVVAVKAAFPRDP